MTGRRVVDRIITDLAVVDVTPIGLVLKELAPGVTVDDVRRATQPTVHVPAEVGTMRLGAEASAGSL